MQKGTKKISQQNFPDLQYYLFNCMACALWHCNPSKYLCEIFPDYSFPNFVQTSLLKDKSYQLTKLKKWKRYTAC